MHKKICILHANCQGDEIERLLLLSNFFSASYQLHRFTNYTREAIPDALLADCQLFLYQHLGPTWENLSSDRLLSKLPPSSLSLRIPNMFFRAYWPFWTNRSPMDFGDSLLDRLIDEGAPKPVILRIYLHGDIGAFADLEAITENSFAIETVKEEQVCVKTVDFIREEWKKKALFHTVNHPGKELLLMAVDGILRELGFPALGSSELAALENQGAFPSYSDFDLPIHPQVAEFHGLQFIRPSHLFSVFGKRMTFEQYVSRYIDCRLNGMETNFLGYVQLV